MLYLGPDGIFSLRFFDCMAYNATLPLLAGFACTLREAVARALDAAENVRGKTVTDSASRDFADPAEVSLTAYRLSEGEASCRSRSLQASNQLDWLTSICRTGFGICARRSMEKGFSTSR
jgi:hypothetical protein